jgi:hypothetical protein
MSSQVLQGIAQMLSGGAQIFHEATSQPRQIFQMVDVE